MKLLKKILFVIGLFFCLSCQMYCQDSFRFRALSLKGGFTYDGVQNVVQDAHKFIWILLEREILRFDGYDYKRYSSDIIQSNLNSFVIFRQMISDEKKNIYLTTNQGIFRYDISKDKFVKVSSLDISFLYFDNKGHSWATTSGSRFYRLVNSLTDTTSCYFNKKQLKFITSNKVYKDKFFFVSNSEKRIYYIDSHSPEKVNLFCQLPSSSYILNIYPQNNYLWVLTRKDGIIQFDISTGKEQGRFDLLADLNNTLLRGLYVDKRNNLWLPTQKGVYYLNTRTGIRQLFTHNQSEPFSLVNNSVWTIYEDDRYNLWIGTYAGGLCYVNFDDDLHIATYTSSPEGLNVTPVSSFAQDGETLWVGTEGGGLNCMNRITKKFTYYRHSESVNSLSYDHIKSLALDSSKRLWIATFRGGLDCLNTRTGQFTHYLKKGNGHNSLYNNDLRKVVLDDDSGLWLVYQYNRIALTYFEFRTNRFIHYFQPNGSYIMDMDKDSFGNVWFVTNEGLFSFNRQTRLFKKYRTANKEVLYGQSLFVDKENNIWIGTNGKGLIKYSPRENNFYFFRDILHYNISSIYSICADNEASLWLGTDNGLFRFHPAAKTFQSFDEKDGFQGRVYYPLASLKGKDGILYLGGTNGFSIVNPTAINLKKMTPNPIISEFYIDNQASPKLTIGDDGARKYVLSYKEENFGFKFSSDNYLYPSKVMFKYRLKGYDDRWLVVDASHRTVMYSKVPSGTYFLEVKVANSDGVWNHKALSLKVVRKPAPWASWYAYLFYISAIGYLIYLVYSHLNERRKLKMQLIVEGLEQQKKDEIHQSQIRLLTNISHEFKTPISLILAAIDSLKDSGIKDYFYRILYNNAHRLLKLVNELMDLKNIEHDKMKLELEPLNINALIFDLSNDFQGYATKRSIHFEVVCDPELQGEYFADKSMIEKIVMNLLNNAFKFTKDGGTIVLETFASKNAFSTGYQHSFSVSQDPLTDKCFMIVVRDSGIGITPESLHKVFDRFYKKDVGNQTDIGGTGIGLALVKSLVLLHKGEISIHSERHQGTDVAVALPTDVALFEEKDFATGENTPGSVLDNLLIAGDKAIEYIDGMGGVMLPDKKRILLVEDNTDLRILIASFLSHDFDILEAANGVEASDILSRNVVHLVISDIMMPLKDGAVLCEEIKSNIDTSHIPVILLTAKTSKDDRLKGVSLGADMYLEKPVDLNYLLVTVKNIFEHQRKLRDYYSKNFFAESAELAANEQDNAFLKSFIDIIDKNLTQPNIDVNFIAFEMSMSRSKLYSKIKSLTDKSIVEFILNYRLRKAARLILEQNISMLQVMDKIGIKSPSYFTSAFKKEFGETPTAFAARHKRNHET